MKQVTIEKLLKVFLTTLPPVVRRAVLSRGLGDLYVPPASVVNDDEKTPNFKNICKNSESAF